MKKYHYHLLTLLLNTVSALVLPYLFVLGVVVVECIMYYMGTLEPSAAAQIHGDENLFPVVIFFTLIFFIAFLLILFFANRGFFRELHTTKIKFISAVVFIFISVLVLDLIIDPFHFMWRFKSVLY